MKTIGISYVYYCIKMRLKTHFDKVAVSDFLNVPHLSVLHLTEITTGV